MDLTIFRALTEFGLPRHIIFIAREKVIGHARFRHFSRAVKYFILHYDGFLFIWHCPLGSSGGGRFLKVWFAGMFQSNFLAKNMLRLRQRAERNAMRIEELRASLLDSHLEPVAIRSEDKCSSLIFMQNPFAIFVTNGNFFQLLTKSCYGIG